MNIIKSIRDENLFKPFLADANGDISSWSAWFTALRCLYGLAIKNPRSKQLVKECTGRDAALLPKDGFSTALLLTGRRSGKSRIAAIVGAYEAAMSGREKMLSAGETGMVAIIAPTKKQGRVVRNYLRSAFEQTPLLRNEVVNETAEGFLLSNGVLIEVLVGDWRAVRGYTLLGCIIDEVCFFGLDAESKVRSDSELLRAVKPSLATTGGPCICVSSPHAERGWAYRQFKNCWGNDAGKTLVWKAPSRTMNPLLDQQIIDDAMAEDAASARSEYYGEWRQDVQTYLPREIIEQCVIKNRQDLLPRTSITYRAFCDTSGGRSDSAALAIGHRDERKIIVDFLREWPAPFNPFSIAGQMAEELKRYHLFLVTGDAYGAEYTAGAFKSHGVSYQPAEQNKNELYLELIGPICSKEIELPDSERLASQLASLERKVRSGGHDLVDHPPGGKDDIANCVAGMAACIGAKRRRAGIF